MYFFWILISIIALAYIVADSRLSSIKNMSSNNNHIESDGRTSNLNNKSNIAWITNDDNGHSNDVNIHRYG